MNQPYCPPGSPSARAYEALQNAGFPVKHIGGQETACSTTRVSLAGNKIGTLVMPDSITPLERLFRRLPVEGTLTATPDRPFSFELGAIDVPQQMSLVLLDYRWAIHVPSGLAVGDTRELEDRRLSLQVGYDVKFTDARKDNLLFEIDPSTPSEATTTFASGSNAGSIPGNGVGGVSASVFDRLRGINAGKNRPAGSSSRPQRHRRDSQLDMPFTYVVNELKRVNFEVTVFRPLPLPVSFFEVEVSGFLIGQNAIQEFMQSVKPCLPKAGSV
jgi:hypothetical protein